MNKRRGRYFPKSSRKVYFYPEDSGVIQRNNYWSHSIDDLLTQQLPFVRMDPPAADTTPAPPDDAATATEPEAASTARDADTEAGKDRKRSFSVAFKLQAVSLAKANSNNSAARKYKVDPKRIREWRQKEATLKAESETSAAKKRVKGGGRKPLCLQLEDEVLEWIRDMRTRRLRVSRKMVKRKEGSRNLRKHQDERFE